MLESNDMDDWVDIERPEPVQLLIRPHRPDSKDTITPLTSGGLLIEAIQDAALNNARRGRNTPTFYVNFDKDLELFNIFLDKLPTPTRKIWTCSRCKRFTNLYGRLAKVDDDGNLIPLVWPDSDALQEFNPAVQAIKARFIGMRVSKEFKIVAANEHLGVACAGAFTHMHVDFHSDLIQTTQVPGVNTASVGELATMLERVLADNDVPTVRKAVTILESYQLSHADNHKASAKWLLDLMEDDKINKAKDETARHNLLYRYAAESFLGSLTQLRSGPLSVLLQSLREGDRWEALRYKWDSMCNPTRYMRPQALPSSGNVAAAERMMKVLGISEKDLHRRMLVQADIPENVIIWRSSILNKKKGEEDLLFSSLETKESKKRADNLGTIRRDQEPAIKISFTKFITKVLPRTEKLECHLSTKNSLAILITALEGTQPLMQWHTETNRASHYVWTHPPNVGDHNLKPNRWNEVKCLVPFPHLWDGVPVTTTFPLPDPDENDSKYKYYHKKLGLRYIFCLDNIVENRMDGLMLFPTLMKSTFHGFRSTLEAYSNKMERMGVSDFRAKGGYVGGVEIGRDDKHSLQLRVTDHHGMMERYEIVIFE